MKKTTFGLFLACCCFFSCSTPSPVCNIIVDKEQVIYQMKQLEQPFKVMFLADTHFTIEDERGKPYYNYSKRMGEKAVEPQNYGITNGNNLKLAASLKKAAKDSVKLVILGGDIINFPSRASVEYILKMMNNSGLQWAYISGNHDWHYEGEPGTAVDQRNKWEKQSLSPLYQGKNPLFYSLQIHGINFLFIDNSTNEILDSQLEFLKKEIAKGLPIVLSMHIPIYLPGQNIDYGCGNPHWNKRNDIYYEIERREPWPENGHSPTTYRFRETVLKEPLIIGIFAGHTHEWKVDCLPNKIQYVSGANNSGYDVLIKFDKN